MFEQWISLLSNNQIFNNIDIEDLKLLIKCLGPKIANYKKNEYIGVAGDKLDGIGIILKGEASISKENAAGNRIIITLLKENNIFGEMAAFSQKQVWPATIQAQEECIVLFISPDKIIGNCENTCGFHRILIQNMLKLISEKALMLNRKVEYLAIKSMRGKISTFLLEQFKKNDKKLTFTLPMNRNEMADFLNVSRPSMSREMCKMKEEGIIDFYKQSIKLIDLKKIKDN